MGHKVVGQKEPWYSGCGFLLSVLLAQVGLILLLVWINWPRK